MVKDCAENDVRRRMPNLALKADYGGSAMAAIRLFCLNCMGGEKDAKTLVKKCASTTCPLWRYRMGAGKLPTPKSVVVQAELARRAKTSEE